MEVKERPGYGFKSLRFASPPPPIYFCVLYYYILVLIPICLLGFHFNNMKNKGNWNTTPTTLFYLFIIIIFLSLRLGFSILTQL